MRIIEFVAFISTGSITFPSDSLNGSSSLLSTLALVAVAF